MHASLNILLSLSVEDCHPGRSEYKAAQNKEYLEAVRRVLRGRKISFGAQRCLWLHTWSVVMEFIEKFFG